MLDTCRPWGKKQHYYYSGVLQSGWLETKDSALTLNNLRLRYRRNFLIFHLSKTTKSDIWCLLLLPATSGYFSPLWNCHTVNFGRKLALPEERNNKKKPGLGSMCERDFPLSSCKPGGSLSLSFGQTETREEQIKKRRQEGGIKRSLFSCLSFLIWRRGGFNLLCVVCTPRDDMTAGFRLLHQHVNRQLRCGMSFVCLWGPNDTLTAVCMRFL